MSPLYLEINGKNILLDGEGCLNNRAEWCEAVAEALASREGITLTQDHWDLIKLLREFYQEYQVIPPLRVFIKTVKSKLGDELGNSIALHKLFPESPLKIACKIAGLPKPKHCM